MRWRCCGAERRLVEVQHWFLERPREWASARFEAGRLGALQESLQERLRRRAAGRLRRQPEPPPGAVRNLPRTLAHVLLAATARRWRRSPRRPGG